MESDTQSLIPETLPDEEVDSLDTPSTPKYTPLSDIQNLISAKGLTFAEAGKILGISAQAVHERCQRHNIMSSKALDRFESNEIPILANIRANCLNTLDEETIEKASALQRMTLYAIAFDKSRLLKGESTENISHDVLLGNADTKREAYEKAMQARLAKAQGDDK